MITLVDLWYEWVDIKFLKHVIFPFLLLLQFFLSHLLFSLSSVIFFPLLLFNQFLSFLLSSLLFSFPSLSLFIFLNDSSLDICHPLYLSNLSLLFLELNQLSVVVLLQLFLLNLQCCYVSLYLVSILVDLIKWFLDAFFVDLLAILILLQSCDLSLNIS